MITDQDIERFSALFQGNRRSYGQYNPNTKSKMVTVRAAYTEEHVRSHLEGESGLGLVTILDDDTCMFAAIDIDTHGANAQAVDLVTLEGRVTKMGLPLVVCRSKSGGAHCYLFLKEKTPAARVRLALARWAALLGYPTAEVFPKQSSLIQRATDSERPLGNWLNLGYYNADSTERYALDGGKAVTLEYFLEFAETKRCNLDDHDEAQAGQEYAVGPPCLETMLKNKIDEGNRNTAVFQAGVFLKRAYPEDWRPRLEEFNREALVSPLEPRELRTITFSVAKKDYQYKCREEPCRSLCNRDLCKTRPHGITDTDATANEIPFIDGVEKIIATPVRWALIIKGTRIEMSTQELFKYEMVRQKVGESMHLVLPRIKAAEWDTYLHEIMGKVKVVYDTTLEDSIFAKLCDFLRRVHVDREREEDDRRQDLQRGMPAMISIGKPTFVAGKWEEGGKDWYYAFKSTDFIEYMRRKKSLTIPDHQIPGILRKLLGDDAKREKMRIGKSRVSNIWCVAEAAIDDEKVPVKRFESEY